jgi:hypothetical protein
MIDYLDYRRRIDEGLKEKRAKALTGYRHDETNTV